MNLLKLPDAHLGIDRGGFQGGVAEELLDVTDVRAAFEHVRGARVPQQVTGTGLGDGSLF